MIPEYVLKTLKKKMLTARKTITLLDRLQKCLWSSAPLLKAQKAMMEEQMRIAQSRASTHQYGNVLLEKYQLIH